MHMPFLAAGETVLVDGSMLQAALGPVQAPSSRCSGSSGAKAALGPARRPNAASSIAIGEGDISRRQWPAARTQLG
jgi:hypothetical protein